MKAIDPDLIMDLQAKDKSLAASYSRYEKIKMERRIQRILLDRELSRAETTEKLRQALARTDGKDQKQLREMVNTYQALRDSVTRHMTVSNPLHTNRMSDLDTRQLAMGDPFPDCEADYPPFDFPPFMPFWGIRKLDPGGLFFDIVAPDVGMPDDPGALVLPNVYITAWGKDKTAWINGTWCFKPPTHIDLCGFTLAGKVKLEGVLENKTGSSVTVKMDAGITQYRVDKEWDEINPSADIPYRNLRAMCRDENNTMYPNGYTDDQYGIHSFPLLTAGIEASFGHLSANCDYQDGDTFYLGYYVEINVGEESFIQFEHSNLGAIVMSKPTLVLHK